MFKTIEDLMGVPLINVTYEEVRNIIIFSNHVRDLETIKDSTICYIVPKEDVPCTKIFYYYKAQRTNYTSYHAYNINIPALIALYNKKFKPNKLETFIQRRSHVSKKHTVSF